MDEKLHTHPANPKCHIYGTRLRSGVKLEANDMYASTSGTWEMCPCPGVVLGEDCDEVWVRRTSLCNHWSDCAKHGGYYPEGHPRAGEFYDSDHEMPCSCGEDNKKA